MAINAIASGLESAGIVEEGAVDRNFLNRVFNSSDYRTQRVIIPYVLNYGVDDYIGQTEAEGNFDQYLRAGGQGAGNCSAVYWNDYKRRATFHWCGQRD
jgi:hypothetical protein